MPEHSCLDCRFEGGIRLIISESEYCGLPSFSLSQESYLQIEEHFNLPQATLHGLTNESGIFSRFLHYSEKDSDRLLKIGIFAHAISNTSI
jgi:hypothetical protein